jgi:hypothetical protein
MRFHLGTPGGSRRAHAKGLRHVSGALEKRVYFSE